MVTDHQEVKESFSDHQTEAEVLRDKLADSNSKINELKNNVKNYENTIAEL